MTRIAGWLAVLLVTVLLWVGLILLFSELAKIFSAICN
jgi:hypothetical protein